MKTSELEKHLNRRGFAWTKSMIFDHPLLDIYENDLQMKDGRPFATINENQRYDMGINPNNYSDELPKSTFCLICDYAATPIDERRELAKKYIVPVPKLFRTYYRIPDKDSLNGLNGKLSLKWSICYGDTPKTDKGIRFTMEEIKKYGLEDYDYTEVQDED